MAEAAEFLRWMDQDHFMLVGYREYDLVNEDGQDLAVPVEGTGLGILRDGRRPAHGARRPRCRRARARWRASASS